MEVYFDNSSTTKSLKEVRDEVYYAMDEFWVIHHLYIN